MGIQSKKILLTGVTLPVKVTSVFSPGAKVYGKQMQGVHAVKNVDITAFPRFLRHQSGVRRMGVHRVFTPF